MEKKWKHVLLSYTDERTIEGSVIRAEKTR